MPVNSLVPWFDWNTRWAPTVAQPDDPGPDSDITWTVPNNWYCQLLAASCIHTGVAGIRSTTASMYVTRAGLLVNAANIATKFGGAFDTRLLFSLNTDTFSPIVLSNTCRRGELSRDIFLEPGDIVVLQLQNPLVGDELHSSAISLRRWEG